MLGFASRLEALVRRVLDQQLRPATLECSGAQRNWSVLAGVSPLRPTWTPQRWRLGSGGPGAGSTSCRGLSHFHKHLPMAAYCPAAM